MLLPKTGIKGTMCRGLVKSSLVMPNLHHCSHDIFSSLAISAVHRFSHKTCKGGSGKLSR